LKLEYAGIKSVGGLGEVPANQTKWLSKNYDITLLMPSHGVHFENSIRENLGLVESEVTFDISLPENEHQDMVSRKNLNLSYLKGHFNGIDIILIHGKDDYTSSIIDDPIVYAPNTLDGKIKLFSLGIKNYVQWIIQNNTDLIPDIVHCHDYHPIPSTFVLKQNLMEYNHNVATVFTIHLMTYPRYPIEFLWDCGIEDNQMTIFIGNE